MPRHAHAKRAHRSETTKRAEEGGFLLLGTLTMILVSSVLVGVGAKEWSVIEKREREQQLLFIQEQYAAAIERFQQDQGRLPTKLEEMIENKGQSNQVFIRKAYTDPMFRDAKLEDWCLLKVGGAGRVVSSCANEGDPNQLGLGSDFQLGEQTGAQQQQLQGLNPGDTGIVGVHSKSTDRAFNILKRGEETYDRWHYTFDQYRKDMNARNIPGLPIQTGPGMGGDGPGGGFGNDSGNRGRGGAFGNQNRGGAFGNDNRNNRNNRNNRR
jgi:type II secretory pathway pseudopilin PulG